MLYGIDFLDSTTEDVIEFEIKFHPGWSVKYRFVVGDKRVFYWTGAHFSLLGDLYTLRERLRWLKSIYPWNQETFFFAHKCFLAGLVGDG